MVAQMFQEDNGQFSAMRVLVFVIVGTVLFNWTYFNLKSGQLSGFDWADLMVVVGPLLAKAAQKKVEK